MEKSGSAHYNIRTKSGKNNVGKLISATSILAISASFGLAMSPISAKAQENKDTTKVEKKADEEVVVVGIRKSLRKAISIKRLNESVVEVATAEDIGKLPGVSIAETLARLPGVAAQRVDGRASVISIRGMAPAYGVTLLNGMEMVSTGDDRSFEYDQFPAELVTQAMIYKTPDAALGTQGLSGTVNINTISPLLANDKKFTVSAKAEAGSFKNIIPGTKSTGSRFSASYIDKLADGKLGVAIGFTHLDTPTTKKYFNPWDFLAVGDLGWGTIDGVPSNEQSYDGFEAGAMHWKGVRDSAMAVFEFKPNDNFKSKLNLFHSTFNQHMNGREFVASLPEWWSATPFPVVTHNNGAAGMTITGLVPIITIRKDDRKDNVDSVAWENEFKLADWDVSANLNYSKAKRRLVTSEAYATPKAPIDLTVTIPTNFDGFGKISTNADLASLSKFEFSLPWWASGAVQTGSIDDEMKSGRISAKHALRLGPINKIETGVIYSERTKDVYYKTQFMALKNTYATCIEYDYAGDGCVAIPANILQSPVNLGFIGIPSMISFDVNAALNSGSFIESGDPVKKQLWNFGVTEKITTGFAKFNFDFGDTMPLHGNFGVQVVHANQSSTGTNDNAGNVDIITKGTSYTDVLPSLNLIGDFGDQTYLKVGIAKTVARPPIEWMRANFNATVGQDHQWSGSGGNPTLEPWRANVVDISLEKYYSQGTYFAAALFYKNITSGIYVKSIPFDFTGFTNHSTYTPTSNMGFLNAPANVADGYIRGYELSGAIELNKFSELLDGFGLTGSFSHTDSNLPGTDLTGNATSDKLDGLSPNVWNLTAYYENNGWQVRLGERYRSKFTAVRHNSFKPVVDTINPEKIVDLQAGYTFQSGALEGLNILLEVNNLTNEPYVTTQTIESVTALNNYHEFGRQYLLGVSYKF